ncbi:uncharacterized protein METZ01_LOCUS441124, partial [marine metagenome]
MENKLLPILIMSTFLYSESDGLGGIELTFGGGSVGSAVPDFKGAFYVNDASASQSTYSFNADVAGAESHTPINLGINANIGERLGLHLGKLDLSTSLAFGYSFLGNGAGVMNVQAVPGVGYTVSNFARLGIGFGIGLLEYQIDFDVERESTSDIFMTFDETDINFDADGKADATLKKSGLVTAPEFSLRLGPPGSMFGLQIRYQQLTNSATIEDPWQITFRETSESNDD